MTRQDEILDKCIHDAIASLPEAQPGKRIPFRHLLNAIGAQLEDLDDETLSVAAFGQVTGMTIPHKPPLY